MHGLALENDNSNFENFRSEEKFRFNFGSEMNDRPQQSCHYPKYARLGDVRTEKIFIFGQISKIKFIQKFKNLVQINLSNTRAENECELREVVHLNHLQKGVPVVGRLKLELMGS